MILKNALVQTMEEIKNEGNGHWLTNDISIELSYKELEYKVKECNAKFGKVLKHEFKVLISNGLIVKTKEENIYLVPNWNYLIAMIVDYYQVCYCQS